MKKLFLIFLCSYLIIIKTLAVDVSISHAGFKGEKENYIEFYFYVVGSTLKQIQIDSLNSQGSLEVTTLFKVNNEVKKFDKFILKSPPTLSPVNFYEMRRYGLENAVYDIEVRFKDVNNPQDSAVYKSMVIIEFNNLSLRQSDITLLNSYRPDSTNNKFTKNGYLMEVLPFHAAVF